jgi:hypothetical protein
MDQREPATRHSQGVLGLHYRAGGATRRCPVQPITPLGPDQVNVSLLSLQGLTFGSEEGMYRRMRCLYLKGQEQHRTLLVAFT